MRVKTTILQTSVFQLFISLLYRRTYLICTQNSRTDTEFAPQFFRHKNIRTYLLAHGTHRICFACFCRSLRRLRETITLRTAFCVFRGFCVKKSHAKAQRARSVMFFCSSVKKYCTQNSQTDTEFASQVLDIRT